MLSTSFADDLERTVAVGARLVSSRAASSPGGGLLVSEPVHVGLGKPCLDAEVALEGWGRVTALCTFGSRQDQLVAVGGEGRATLVELDDGRFVRSLVDVELPFRAAAFTWDGRLLWAFGSEHRHPQSMTIGGEDLRGEVIPPSILRTVRSPQPVLCPTSVAWGNGGVAMVTGRRPSLRRGADRAPTPAG